MANDFETFGRRLLGLTDTAYSGLQEPLGHQEFLAALDEIILHCLTSSLGGQRIVEIQRGVQQNDVLVVGLSEDQKSFLKENYLLSVQQSRGAWYLPDNGKVRGGLLNLVSHSYTYPSFPNGISQFEDIRVRFDRAPDGLFIWSLLTPLFESLLAPLELRGPLSGTLSREKQIEAWQRVQQFFDALQIDISEELSVFLYGGGWSKLRAAEQLTAKRRFVRAIQEAIVPDTVRRYRLVTMRPLIEQYYQKAKRQPPLMRQVLTKPLQRTLSGLFGGDWLKFVDYLGEVPSSDERIAKALPEVPLFVESNKRAQEVALAHGVPVEEVERMLSLMWNSSSPVSPVEQRTEVMKRFWTEVEQIQSRQMPGMPPLWGLLDEEPTVRPDVFGDEQHQRPDYSRGIYKVLLSTEILTDIKALWSTKVLKSWPDRLVTEFAPLSLMQEALGPALRFWHGCALTVWFICEGPTSRTDLNGLANYYRRELAELEEMGCAVSPGLFADLLAAEPLLGKEEPITRSMHNGSFSGVEFSSSISWGSRKAGFEHLRDIVSSHMRAWTLSTFDRYLMARLQSDIQGVGKRFYQMIELKGKAPSLRQFAPEAIGAANRWFGGDIGALFSSFGEMAPTTPTYSRLLPPVQSYAQSFAFAVFSKLGGTPTSWTKVSRIKDDTRREKVWDTHTGRVELAILSVYYIQVREAIGKAPTLKEFGKSKIQWWLQLINEDQDKAWKRYSQAVEKVLTEFCGELTTSGPCNSKQT